MHLYHNSNTESDNELVLTDYYNGGKVLAKIDTAGRFVQTSRFMHASNNEVIALSAGSEGSIELHNVYRFSNTFYPQKRIASASCHSVSAQQQPLLILRSLCWIW